MKKVYKKIEAWSDKTLLHVIDCLEKTIGRSQTRDDVFSPVTGVNMTIREWEELLYSEKDRRRSVKL